MAEVTTRGGGLIRGAHQRTRGRGRGRGASNATSGSHLASTGPNGLEHKVNGLRSSTRPSANHQDDEPEELKFIRKKHGHNLPTIRELFPSWTDEDLLMALNEASGDLELAAARISEGLTEQWGSVKTKKDKKLSSPTLPSSQHPRSQGFTATNTPDGRASRGRSDASRGTSRGGGRGAAPRGVGRGQSTAGPARGPQATAENSSIGATTPSSWNLVASAPRNDSAGPSGPSVTPAALSNGLGQSADLGSVSQTAGAIPSEETKSVNNQPSQSSQNGPSEPSKWLPDASRKSSSRVIAPGTKMSWAQVARPIEPPKAPAPLPPQFAATSGPDAHTNETKKTESTAALAHSASSNSQLHDGQITINLPDSTGDVWNTEPVPAIDDLKTTLSGAGPNVWNDDPVLQPLGVGEGWADAVLAQPSEAQTSIFDQQSANKIVLTPSDAPNIGPIELTTPSVLKLAGTSMSPPSTNVADRALQLPEPPSILATGSTPPPPPASSSMLAPPGLTKRANTRKGQEAAVVMPGSGTPSMDRMGLKFGSLSLFGDAAEAGEALPAASLDMPSPPTAGAEEAFVPETSLKPDDNRIESLAPPQPAGEAVKSPTPPAVPQIMEKQPTPPQINHQSAQPAHAPQNVEPQPLNPPAAPAQSSTAQPHASTFSSRYPSNNQYATSEPHATQQVNNSSQAPQPHQQDAFSHYSGFRQDPMAAYFQQQQQQQQPQQPQQQQQQQQQQSQSALAQHSNSPVPASQTPAAYGAFNHMNQQVLQQSQQPTQTVFGQPPQSVPDYAAIYGQEALRSLGYYDSYAHVPAGQTAFQNRSPNGGAEDTVKSTGSTLAAPPGQPQQVGHHQHMHPAHQPQQQQQQPGGASASSTGQQYPGMQPSPMPYPYYPYYQQYGQLPPNYQNPAYPYALQGPSPYYSVQGSQQYQAANSRAGQSQYPMQGGPGSNVAAGPNSLPISHAHQQHASQHGLGGAGVAANNTGFRQVSQPGAGGNQIPGAQVSGQGLGVNSGLVGTGGGSGMPPGQQPSSMHQQHAYYATGYGGYGGDPQQAQQGGGVMGGSTNTGHHHHHHQAQQQHTSRQSGHHQHHHHVGNQGHVGGGPTGASGAAPGANERKDPFTFASDRFFNQ